MSGYSKCQKLKPFLLNAINQLNKELDSKKKKAGRPIAISDDKCIDAIFNVLIHGLSWELASKLTFGTTRYKSTLNRRYCFWGQ